MAELVFNVDTTAIDTLKNATISANFEELSIALKELASNYETVLYTDDEIPEAKKELAKLRSLQKHISDYRIFVKKQVSAPIDKFNDECKKVTSILDGAVLNLDRQIKESEEKRKQEKLFMIEQFFNNSKAEMKHPDFVTLDNVLNEKWANKGYTLEQAYKDIRSGIETVDSEVAVIKGMHSEFELSLLDCYKSTHSLPQTMQMNERLKEQKRQEEERRLAKERYEIEQQKAAAQEPEAETISIADPSHLFYAAPESEQPMPEAEPVYCATYQVWATDKELNALSSLLKNLKVKYQTINVTRVN